MAEPIAKPLPPGPPGTLDEKELGKRQLVWGFVQEIGTEERHFNELQSKYRSMAAGWVLACFSGIWAVWSHALDVGIDRLLVIGGIGFAGALGLLLLWRVDVLVYHPLLEACFAEGLKLEKRNRWLPRLRKNMATVTVTQSVLSHVVWFYVLPVVVFALFTTGGVAWYLWERYRLEAAIVVCGGLLATYRIALYMRRKTDATSAAARDLRKPA